MGRREGAASCMYPWDPQSSLRDSVGSKESGRASVLELGRAGSEGVFNSSVVVSLRSHIGWSIREGSDGQDMGGRYLDPYAGIRRHQLSLAMEKYDAHRQGFIPPREQTATR